jgi:hypothetical protein
MPCFSAAALALNYIEGFPGPVLELVHKHGLCALTSKED